MKVGALYFILVGILLNFPWNVQAQTCYNDKLLGVAASSAAYFPVNCPVGTSYLAAQVNLQEGAGEGSSVRLQIQRSGFISSNVAVDDSNGNNYTDVPTCGVTQETAPSSWVYLKPSAQKTEAQGSGSYSILISKTGNSELRYGLNLACVQSVLPTVGVLAPVTQDSFRTKAAASVCVKYCTIGTYTYCCKWA